MAATACMRERWSAADLSELDEALQQDKGAPWPVPLLKQNPKKPPTCASVAELITQLDLLHFSCLSGA
jgi:hypothetical protein